MKKNKTMICLLILFIILVAYFLYSFVPMAVPITKGLKIQSIELYHHSYSSLFAEPVKNYERYDADNSSELEDIINNIYIYRNNIFSYNYNSSNIFPKDGLRTIRVEVVLQGIEGSNNKVVLIVDDMYGGITYKDGKIHYGIVKPYVTEKEHLELFKKLESFVFK